VELRQQGHPGATACDLEGFVYQGKSFFRPSRLGVGTRLDEQDQRPEHWRSLQALVQVYPLADLRQPLLALSHPGVRCAKKTHPQRPPDLEIMVLHDLQHAYSPAPDEFGLTPPEVQEASVEEPVGQREWVLQFGRQRNGVVCTLERTIGVAEHPQG
jgi:hypothetical protein